MEAIGHTGLYNYVEFVGEYGPFDLHDLDNLARAGDMELRVVERRVFETAIKMGVPPRAEGEDLRQALSH